VNRYACLEEDELCVEGGSGKCCEQYSWEKPQTTTCYCNKNLKRAENKQSSVNAMGTRHSHHLRRVISKC